MKHDDLFEEAVQYLQEYIRINTVNPPGNEIEGARFFQRIFERDSIPCQIFEPSPGRGNLLATLRGDGTKKPVLLLSHMDVVPAEKDQWDTDPFESIIKDGYLYGRGALDNKSMGIVEMMVLLILKRKKIPLKRDILFFASSDEETGGRWGVEWAVENLPVLRDAGIALNEGGYVILNEDGTPDRYEISSGQKVIFQLKLKTTGTPGHASMPMADNPNVKLVHALEELTKWETPFTVLPMVKEYFYKLAPKQPKERKAHFEDVERGLQDPAFSTWLTSNPLYNAMVRNTLSLTVLEAGKKVNVVPSESKAMIDCRLIPGTSREDFLKEIKEKLGSAVQVDVLPEGDSPPPSPLDTDLYHAIVRFAARNDPGAPVVPHLLPGGTDARYLRKKGITAYDFCPFRLTEKEMLRIHGNNERISLENLKFGMKLMMEVIKEIST